MLFFTFGYKCPQDSNGDVSVVNLGLVKEHLVFRMHENLSLPFFDDFIAIKIKIPRHCS
uniref:Uncharacterized protein MANES_02G058700 n=1 Tax=Rhizophora mucronata TaxID=61149 RepID=A0A2P2LIL3_RHIMU